MNPAQSTSPSVSQDENTSVSFVDAMAIARRSIALFTEQAIDAVVSCGPSDTGWLVKVDVIESSARMGDNDLLATYEVALSQTGDVTAFNRLRRYHREDKEGAA